MLLTETQLLTELEKIGFPPLKIKSLSMKNLTADSPKTYHPDAVLELDWQGNNNCFLTELIPVATPQNLFLGEQKLKQYFQDPSIDKEKYHPLIVTTYLKPNELDRFANSGISAIDLCGNGIVQIPGKWFIHRSGTKNIFPTSTPIKNIFVGTSSLVARIFFSKESFTSVNQVLDEVVIRQGQITLPTVSKVLKVLQQELLITKDSNKVIKLLDAKKLLSNLVENYQKPFATNTLLGKVPDLNTLVTQLNDNAKKYQIPLVAFNPNLYALMPSQSFIKLYTTNLDKLLTDINITKTNRFPNIEIQEVSDPIIYFDTRYQNDCYWLSPLQTYLELANGDSREQDTSKQIEIDLINLKYLDQKN